MTRARFEKAFTPRGGDPGGWRDLPPYRAYGQGDSMSEFSGLLVARDARGCRAHVVLRGRALKTFSGSSWGDLWRRVEEERNRGSYVK